ncbi:MAG: uroporphyrinogen-III C-methyltransferase [Rhizobiales bacterium 68-8]|nr:MAG: uroporphyrinogen-III C-methyltransferase [Rhizobiales bacterium 68-8]
MSARDAIASFIDRAPRLQPGHVWLAGAGPGDPGMVTLDVVAALSQAEVVVHDALIDARVLELAAGAELVDMGKRGGRPSPAQEEINARLIALARAGRRVVRLKGGDPFIFGRGGEEALALALAGIPFRVLPGLTSALGALAATGIPATMRGINHAVTFATGHAVGTDDDLDWAALARTGQPIVIYMGMRNLEAIAAALAAGGLPGDTPAAVIASATTGAERTVVATLATIHAEVARQGIGAPALIVVGHIVEMREKLGHDRLEGGR